MRGPILPVAGAGRRRRWTDEEDATLLASETIAAAAAALGRTVDACKRRRFDLKSRSDEREAAPSPNAWQPWELELLTSGATLDELVKATGRTRAAVKNRRNIVKRERFAASLRGAS